MLSYDNTSGTDDVIILGSTTHEAADINTIGIDAGTDMVTLDSSVDSSNEGKSVGLLFG